MAPRAALCVVALVAIVSTASASRLFSGVEDYAWKVMSQGLGADKEVAHAESYALSVTQLTSSLETLVSGVEGPFDGPVHVTAEFFPAPTTHHAFVMEFGRMAEMVRRCGAKVAVHLTKPMGDNIKFVAYMYAASPEEFHKLFQCEGLRDFMRFLGDRNIPVTHQRLIKLGAAGFHATPGAAAAATSFATVTAVTPQGGAFGELDVLLMSATGDEAGDSVADPGCAPEVATDQITEALRDTAGDATDAPLDPKGRHAPPRVIRMATRFEVPPGAGKTFVHAWKKLACKAGRWKGSRGLALFGTAGDNTHYLGYTAWEVPRHRPSKKEQEEKMKVFRKWRKEVEDLGVAFHTEPVIPVRPPPHH